jgi:hypothetical protein
MSKVFGWLIAAVGVGVVGIAIATAPERHTQEFERVISRLMEMTAINAADGFTAKVIIPPGQLYDPLSSVAYGDGYLLNDDGGVEGEKGSRILKVSMEGEIEVVVGLDKLPPVTGFDVAPEGFGDFGGHLFVLTQPRVGPLGIGVNHLVQRIEIGNGVPEVVCELPALAGGEQASVGTQAKFGPADSPFSNLLFTVTLGNNTIYQTTADGTCTPFVTFDGSPQGQPFYLTFTPEHQTMLVSLGTPLALGAAPPSDNPGRIARVSADGTIDAAFYATGLGRPAGMAFAPDGYGAYGGHLFVNIVGSLEIPVPINQQLKRDAHVLRIAPDGSQHMVADGFINPMDIKFIHGRLIVGDINGDFIAGGREVPDGFVVEILPE